MRSLRLVVVHMFAFGYQFHFYRTALCPSCLLSSTLTMLARRILTQSFRFRSMAAKLDISGIFPPVPTPFNDEMKIDVNRLQENFEKWNTKGFRGIAEDYLFQKTCAN